MAIVQAWILLLLTIGGCNAYNNGRGAKPPMGWNSWCTDGFCNAFGMDICTDETVRSITDAMVSQGMDKLGYQYVLLDDCWSAKTRDADGKLMADPTKFPSGITAVADYVHSKNLSFGLYTCVGTTTCKGDRPGSNNHWKIDADTLASWGVDFVKMDHCSANHSVPDRQLYGNMSQALNATGRPILFSLCQWGGQQVCEWGAEIAQMFRIQMDHLPFWDFPNASAGVGLGQGTSNIIEFVAELVPSKYIKQYGYLDPDFLMTLYPVTMSFVDSRTEYTFWSLWSSPLIVCTDIREKAMTDDKKSILMNPEVIAINQDDLITAGDRLRGVEGGTQVWVRDLANGDKAVVLYNSGNHKTPLQINVTWSELGLSPGPHGVRDLWARKSLGMVNTSYVTTVGPHDVSFIRILN
eukprot:m.77906 g.77906  ORF g.77906 m.77906 type:complete len:409 (+) comp25062_c0_seq3:21-1247(+)